MEFAVAVLCARRQKVGTFGSGLSAWNARRGQREPERDMSLGFTRFLKTRLQPRRSNIPTWPGCNAPLVLLLRAAASARSQPRLLY